MQDRIVQQDTYSKKDNRLFTNIKEAKDENCEQNINLKMDKERVEQIKIVRSHRLGV